MDNNEVKNEFELLIRCLPEEAIDELITQANMFLQSSKVVPAHLD